MGVAVIRERERTDVHVPEGAGPAPCVLIAHGFKGFRNWGFFPWLADRLAEAGFAAVRYDFSHNGADESGEFPRLDLFRENTITREVEELRALVDAVASGEAPFGGRCRPDAIGVLGHSRGGGDAILLAANESRVVAVATIAAIARADRFPEEARRQAVEKGFFEVANARTGQLMPVGRAYFEDAARHDILGAAAAMTQPLLLIHGTSDESVPIDEGEMLLRAAGSRASWAPIGGEGHTLGAVHPFAGPTRGLARATEAVVRFFRRHLTG